MMRTLLAALLAIACSALAAGSAAAYQSVDAWPNATFRGDRPARAERAERGDRGARQNRRARVVRASYEDNDDEPVIRRGRTGRSATSRTGERRVALTSLTRGSGYQSGVASVYWEPQGLASGGRFNPNAMTAAHRTLPFGTRVRVTNLNSGRSAVVTINDRGPYVGGRVIDLSRASANAVGVSGLGRVKLDVIGR